ncbi:MAG: hypothetical protein WAO98_08275 [Alphaproteobacteria bacterium]
MKAFTFLHIEHDPELGPFAIFTNPLACQPRDGGGWPHSERLRWNSSELKVALNEADFWSRIEPVGDEARNRLTQVQRAWQAMNAEFKL